MLNSITKHWLLLIILLSFCPAVRVMAQQSKISVASFQKMECDIKARVTAPKIDHNGVLCAFISIVTT